MRPQAQFVQAKYKSRKAHGSKSCNSPAQRPADRCQLGLIDGQAADLRLQTMIVLACSLGLRPSELLALQWLDFDLSRGQLLVSRSITGRYVAATKTEDSEDDTFLDSRVLALLLRWQDECPETLDQWLFPNVDTGRPFHADSLRKDYLRPLGERIGIPNLGWYAFRHTYRTVLDDVGTPIGVQQKLMRHSDIGTTMNTYGSAYEHSKRLANERVAGKLLGSIMTPAQRQLVQ
jgi:integrase